MFNPCELQLFLAMDKLHFCSRVLDGTGGGPGTDYGMLYQSAIYRATPSFPFAGLFVVSRNTPINWELLYLI